MQGSPQPWGTSRAQCHTTAEPHKQAQAHTQTHVQMSLTEALTGKHAQPQSQRQVPEHTQDPRKIFSTNSKQAHVRQEGGTQTLTPQTHRLVHRSTNTWKTRLMCLVRGFPEMHVFVWVSQDRTMNIFKVHLSNGSSQGSWSMTWGSPRDLRSLC